MASNDDLFKEIIIHLKEKGFIFQGSEIYSGLANTWDYGPLGVKLKNNIKQRWWDFFIEKNQYNVGLDSSILMNSKVWTVSGHLSNFSDPLIDCKICKARFRADNLINDTHPNITLDGWSNEKLEKFISDNKIKCLKCGKEDWTSIRQFQLMFETHQGVIKDNHNKIYLRPETAQGIFINFNNVRKSVNQKIPFGIGQIGKSFRNEITPGNFIFRTREFEQMELEFFFIPQNQKDNTWFDYWVNQCKIFLASVGLSNSKNLSFKQHESSQLAHYALATTDIEYNFPFGMNELCGICNRGNYDLTKHSESSGVKMEVQDPNVVTKKMVIPSVIEPSMGVERLLLALICEAYTKEVLNDGRQRIVLKLDKSITPFQVAIIPSNKNKFGVLATKIFHDLKHTQIRVVYAYSTSIGKSYRYQDGIGTMYCVTVDYATEEQNTVTVRDRNTMQQEIVPLNLLKKYLYNKLDISC